MKPLINFNKVVSKAVKLEGLKHSITIADGKEVIGHFCDELVKAAKKRVYFPKNLIGSEVIRLVKDRIKRKKTA